MIAFYLKVPRAFSRAMKKRPDPATHTGQKEPHGRRRAVYPIRILPFLICCPFAVQAGLFKCQQSDGSVSYQQTPCPESASQYELDTHQIPSGATGTERDYSIEAQLKRMQQSRREEQKERQKRSRAVGQEQGKGESDQSGEDTADCAKFRAQVAEWKRRNLGGYSNRDDRDYRKNKLRYYQIKARDACGE